MSSVRHPAKFTDAILEVMAGYITAEDVVLDPFAGTGRIHKLGDKLGCVTLGIEIEPEWAEMDPRTQVGDALALPFGNGSISVVATSPTYGNRMADHHEARDASRRNTYRHALGRPLRKNNSGMLQWGTAYRDFHTEAWREAWRVLVRGGTLLLNVKDHVRSGRVIPVSEWHRGTCQEIGFVHRGTHRVEAPGLRHGANHGARVEHEDVHVFTKP